MGKRIFSGRLQVRSFGGQDFFANIKKDRLPKFLEETAVGGTNRFELSGKGTSKRTPFFYVEEFSSPFDFICVFGQRPLLWGPKTLFCLKKGVFRRDRIQKKDVEWNDSTFFDWDT